MPKMNILVVSYSQTGQLDHLTQSFTQPLSGVEHVVEYLKLTPQTDFPFPWPFMTFFNTFPETVHLQPRAINAPQPLRSHYDLVILAYSVWFLSPAQPMTAFLQSSQAAAILHNTPVITLIGCRNMWLMAQEKIKLMLQQNKARLVDNVVKIDGCGSVASFITTPYWMLTGKKRAFSWLPPAGITEADFLDTQRMGHHLAQTLFELPENSVIPEAMLRGQGAVTINEKLITSERFAHRSFYLWGKLLLSAGAVSTGLRKAILVFYIVFLIGIILTVAPLSAAIKVLLRPLTKKHIQQQKQYFSWPSGE
ncbi:hypothetical protein [Snodgrassella sp. CFCC 13594]|uniref:hypothetical protein n=1 Tax=Snodgrassella sp. CFCC 13594 TaxID=1775559 RepID=UPI0008370814|nr:hypothetical protein [Snodgrassella sp. CFCC 13594]